MTLGTTATFSAGTPTSLTDVRVPSEIAMTADARRAAARYSARGSPRRSGKGTGPHSAHTTRGATRRESRPASSCSFL